ncbi:MFS transporter [Dechloromonas sp.]|uniref:MFS transporter n=1 Tax=Dechloromonas sp. TaxID=1917218 RepID=UPI00121C8F8B|nr:MFS transporter [Dechloromonas sp.]MBU3697830.1 MFS transporter [Dechloromonas sp.]TEX48521.1 MAG: hypothetical protein CFR70_06460 [Rhodocyclaceae bacterium]
MESTESDKGAGLRLAAVQFVFTLGWTVYVVFLPALLARAGLPANWLPWLLIIDQAIFAIMDIAFGLMADRIGQAWQRLARAILWLSTLSALAFLALPLVSGVAPAAMLAVTLLWVVTASVVRAPTMVLLAKQARAAQQPALVAWYSGGMALAMALSPFFGLWLKGSDPLLPFAVSAAVLWLAVVALLRWQQPLPASDESALPPLPFASYRPLLAGLLLAAFGLQLHAFVNAGPLFGKLAEPARLPWLLPWLWVGFAAAMPMVGALCKRCGALRVAGGGLLAAAAMISVAPAVNWENSLMLLQLLAGFGWGLAFAGLMSFASAAGSRGAEGLFMGSFFAMTAVAAVARILVASQWLPALGDSRYTLPATCLFIAACGTLWLARRLPDRH